MLVANVQHETLNHENRPKPIMHDAKPQVSPVSIIGLIFIVGLALRALQSGESLWLDELHTGWTIRDGLSQIGDRARLGNNSPLYFYFPWLTTRVLGWNEVALRLPSIAAGSLAVALSAWVVWRWTQSMPAAVTTGLLAACDPHALFYSLEARPYALVHLFAVIHLACFVAQCRGSNNANDRRSNRAARIGWIVSGIVLFHLHYTTALVFVAETIALLAILIFNRRSADSTSEPSRTRPWTSWLIDAASIIIGSLFAIPHVLEVFGRRQDWSAFVATPDVRQATYFVPVLWYAVVPLALWLLFRWFGKPRGDSTIDQQNVGLNAGPAAGSILGLWYFVPLVLAFLLTACGLTPIFLRRYLVASWIAGPLLAGWLVGSIRSHVVRGHGQKIAAAVICVAAIAAVGPRPADLQQQQPVQRADEQWRDMMPDFTGKWRAYELPVFLDSGLIETKHLPERTDEAFLEYCRFPLTGFYDWDIPTKVIHPLQRGESLTPEHIDVIRKKGGAMFVIRSKSPESRLKEITGFGLRDKSLYAPLMKVKSYGDIMVAILPKWFPSK